MKTKVASNSDMPISKIAVDRIALDPRRGAEGRRRAARRDERDRVAGLQREGLGQAAPDRDALARVEVLRALPCRMLPAIVLDLARSSARTPRTSTPLPLYGEEPKAWPSTSGMARRRPATAAMRCRDLRVVGQRRCRAAATKMWPLMPTILSSSSLRKPFITDSTTISVATPSMMPRNEKPAMTETKPSRRRVRR